jgi:hypothetical protein
MRAKRGRGNFALCKTIKIDERAKNSPAVTPAEAGAQNILK